MVAGTAAAGPSSSEAASPLKATSYDGSLPLAPIGASVANGTDVLIVDDSNLTGLPPGFPVAVPTANGTPVSTALSAGSKALSSPDSAVTVVPLVIKSEGKVDALVEHAYAELSTAGVDLGRKFDSHVGIAHTRWATHGAPSTRNSHPVSSGSPENEWLVVHNGIITNWKALKNFLVSCPAILTGHMH